MKNAIVIIPTYNEAGTIQRTVQAVLAIFDKITDWKMGILVVDDTSPDKTYTVVEALRKDDSRVHLLVNKQKAGLGSAYLKGMEHAFDTLKADVVFEFDADLSHDPTKIPLFLKSIERGNDLVLGSRYIKGGSIPSDWGLHRKFLSKMGNLVIMCVLTNFKIKDWTSGYRALTEKVFRAVSPRLRSERFSGYTFQIGFLYHALKLGFKVDSNIPYHFSDRTVGESKIGPEYIKNTLSFILRVRIKEILAMKLFKFALVGGIGALVQLSTLYFWRMVAPYELATFLSIECAVVSNFILNNLWTFADQKLHLSVIPKKFIQFNLASFGSIFIQYVIALGGKYTIGIHPLFTIPGFITIDTAMLFAVVGILVGMVWNFFAYSKFVWKSAKK
ncbi:glycosyltransferase family 2 protein [Candidatus Woesebacteria bacterium]|nr:glycosyltransferase family 2 protein [Candidatus Woesebacteria bacterium]